VHTIDGLFIHTLPTSYNHDAYAATAVGTPDAYINLYALLLFRCLSLPSLHDNNRSISLTDRASSALLQNKSIEHGLFGSGNSDSDRMVNTIVGAMVINHDEGEDQAWCKVHKIPMRKVSSDYYGSVFTMIWGGTCSSIIIIIYFIIGVAT